MIDGETKKVGVMGWPLSHTLSPFMHNAAFAAARLNYIYLPLPVEPDNLESAVSGLKALGFSGANVTIPHKVTVMRYLDQIDRPARLIGAVNTIVNRNGRLVGYNTDVDGFISSLKEQEIEIRGINALLLGAGGAARAVACGLAESGVNKIIVAARDRQKTLQFIMDFKHDADIIGTGFSGVDYIEASSEADLVINCTPLGMKPQGHEMPTLIWERLRESAVVCDLVYNPQQTRLLTKASQRGHKTVGGLGMLVEQGAIAFELWTGVRASRRVMYQAIADITS